MRLKPTLRRNGSDSIVTRLRPIQLGNQCSTRARSRDLPPLRSVLNVWYLPTSHPVGTEVLNTEEKRPIPETKHSSSFRMEVKKRVELNLHLSY
jgi:hypothetical protein